jgi:hypothetical protein
MTKRKWQLEDYIVTAIATVLICLIFFFMEGCAAKQVQDTEIIWHDGTCFLFVKNMSIEQAKNMQKSIKFDDCTVIFDDDLTEGVPQ